MRPKGREVLLEFISCFKNILDNKSKLEEILTEGIEKSGLNLISIYSHKFEPIGITAVAILSESHVIIHTYPESKHVSIDIFTCSDILNKISRLINFLKIKFKPSSIKLIDLVRGDAFNIENKNWIIDSSSAIGFSMNYYIKKRIFSGRSRYQQIDVIENENFGKMLFLDNDLQVTEKDAYIYNSQLIHPLFNLNISLGNILILGGGDGSVLYELLKHNPKRITLVDIDEEVVKIAKKFFLSKDVFKDKRVKVIIDDAYKFLSLNNKFDVVIYDLTMHPESLRKINREKFLDKLFLKIRKNLDFNGILVAQCCSEFDIESLKLIKKTLVKNFKNINFSKVFIPSYGCNWIFVSAEVK